MVDNEKLNTEVFRDAGRYVEFQAEADKFILESSAVIVVEDKSGKIIRITAEVESELGYLTNELLGEQIEVLVPDAVRARHPSYRTGQSGFATTRQMAHGRVVSARRKDGTERKVTISLKSKYVVWNGEKLRLTRANLIFAPTG